MPVYTYKAVNSKGEEIQGRFTAKDQSEILQMIRKNQYHPVSVKEEEGSKDIRELEIFQRITLKDMAVFCRQFYAMLNAGVTIIQCLDTLREQVEKKKFRGIIDQCYEAVQKGATLSEALKNHSDIFPELLINMVEAGEVSGKLDEIMERMAIHYDKENRIQNKIKSALVYPIILTIVSVLVITFLVAVVMPTFIGMFQHSGMALPLPTRILLAVSYGVRDYWYVIIAVLALVLYSIWRFIRTDFGGQWFDRLKMRLPVVKGLVVIIATARFSRNLSTLLASGVPMMRAMEVVSRIVGNSVISGTIQRAKEEMRKGFDLAGPIRRAGIFPPMIHSMIVVGEESGTLDEVLEKTADFYDEEVDMALQRLVTLFEPLMIILMAVFIGFIVISIALPLFELPGTFR